MDLQQEQPPVPGVSQKKSWFIPVIGILVVGLLTLIALILLPSGNGLFVEEQLEEKEFQGALIVHTLSSWNTPGGEETLGTVRFEPESGVVTPLFYPELEIQPLLHPGVISQDGNYGIGVRAVEDGIALIRFSFNEQTVDTTYTTLDTDTFYWDAFLSSRWSPDNKTVAYLSSVDEGGLPQEPVTFVADGTQDPMSVASTFPIMFSPDGGRLLVGNPKELAVVSLGTGATVSVPGDIMRNTNYTIEQVITSPGGTYLATLSINGDVDLYKFNWESETLVFVQTLPTSAEQVVMSSTNDRVALLSTLGGSPELYVYTLEDTPILEGRYTIPIPEEVLLLGWFR